MQKFIITLECRDKSSLADLIDLGLERHATIVKIDTATTVVEQPDPAPVAVPAQEPEETSHGGRQKPKPYTQKIKGYELYDLAWQVFGVNNKSFTSRDLKAQWAAWGRPGSEAISAHLHRFGKAGLIKRVGGNLTAGWQWAISLKVNRREFDRAVSRQKFNQTSRQKLARKFGGAI